MVVKVKKNLNLFVCVITLIAALGGFILGFDAGVIVDGKDQITSEFLLSNMQWSTVASVSILGTFFAVLISGKFVDKFGTKAMLIIAALGFLISLVLTASAHNLTQLVIGRFITGICIGITSFGAPLFISEISSPAVRGGMILLNGVAITAGQTLSFLAGYFLHDISSSSWRIILWIEVFSACCFFIGLLFMPRSPRWIAKNNGIEKARAILNKIRSGGSIAIEKELNEIEENISRNFAKPCLSDLFSKKMTPVLIVGIGLGVLQQLSGIGAVMYYGPVIFQTLGYNSIKDAIFATFIIGLINLIFTIISVFLVDYLGRRFLLLLGTFVAAVSMFFVSTLCLGLSNPTWVMLFMMTYIIGYCISLGSLFWVMISEIYPFNIRGSAMSMITAIQSAASFGITITFLQLFNVFGNRETFFFFGVMCFVACIFVYLYVPETKGVQLELIEANLIKGRKTRYLGQLIDC